MANKTKSNLATAAAIAGATLVGAAAGVTATIMANPKKRKEFEKKAQKTVKVLQKQGKIAGSRLKKDLDQLKVSVREKLSSMSEE